MRFVVSLGHDGACPSILCGARISGIIDPGYVDFGRKAHWRCGIISLQGDASPATFMTHGNAMRCPAKANKKLRFIKQNHAEIA